MKRDCSCRLVTRMTWADALQRLYADTALRHRLSAAALDKISKEYDLASNAAELANYFHKRENVCS